MKSYLLLFLISIFFTSAAYSQIDSKPKSDSSSIPAFESEALDINKLKKRADKHFEKGDYNIALKEYSLIMKSFSKDPETNFRFGSCIIYSNFHKEKAIPYFETAIEFGHIEAIKLLGLTYHEMYKFDEALEKYNLYISKVDTTSKKFKSSDIHRLIKNSKTALDLINNPVDVQIENVGKEVNSPYADYSPIVTADDQEIFFTTRRSNTTGGDTDHNDEYYEDIFYSEKDSLGNWQPARHLSDNINSHHHDAVAGLSADGQTLIIYRNDMYGYGGDLYISYLRDTTWSQPIKMSDEISRPESWEPSATLTANEDAIYFSSDRPGGFGGLDIYMAKRQPNGKYANPINLGPNINTQYDEDAPFIAADGNTLYFSSKGHTNMGGYDVFKSEKDFKNEWQPAQNMGYPINTTDDDIYFTINAAGTHGYYSSLGADSYGEKDIYMIKFKPKEKTLAILKGKVTDVNNKPIAAQIFVNKANINKLNGLFNSNAGNGKYLVVLQPRENYRIIFKATGYISDTLYVNAKEFIGFKEVIKDIILKKESDPITPQTVLIKTHENIVIGKVDTTAASKPKDYLTDSTQKQSIIDTNGTLVKKNTIKKDTTIKPITMQLDNKKGDATKLFLFDRSCEIDFSDSLHIMTFHIGYKKVDLSPQQYAVLDSLIKPKIDKIVGIKINAHTDNIGSVKYNMILSQDRAMNMANYFKKIGVPSKKLVACFYGKSKPIAPNQNEDGSDNPEGRYLNRRIEIEFFMKE